MNDKELLEFAAKAAGYLSFADANKYMDMRGNDAWNPLTDDGDALRLAVKLHFEISVDSMSTSISGFLDSEKDFVLERHNNDIYAATRRAIVRAAAEIGKEMK